MAGPIPKTPGLVELIAYNTRFPDVYLRKSGLRWRLPFPFTFSLAVDIRDSFNMSDPTSIKTGASFVGPLLDNVDWEIKRIIEDEKFIKAGWFQKFIYLEVMADSQQKFKVPLPPELKRSILFLYAKGKEEEKASKIKPSSQL